MTPTNVRKDPKQYLQEFVTRYTRRTQTSKQFAQTYRSVLADNRASAEFSPPLKELCYPIVAARSRGSKIWDIDGNEYIDAIMGFGVNLFGHDPDFVRQALTEQLAKGIQLGPQTEQVGEVASAIAKLAGMERVAFSNTGTEAMMTAMRLARAATGRPKIAMFSGSYHGHFDGALAKADPETGSPHAAPLAPGVLPNFVDNLLVLDYDNAKSLEIIENCQHELAAVLVEPVQSRRPNLQPRSFLQQLRQLTRAAGIALIFDEMVTGFRIHPGGAQAWFEVEADIAAYGKIIGGGLPIGVIAGKAVYLDKIDGGFWRYGDGSAPSVEPTFFAGTYCKHPLALAAAQAVVRHLQSEGPQLQQRLNRRTAEFVGELNDYFTRQGLPLQMAHFGSLFGPATAGETESSSSNETGAIAMKLLIYLLRDRGVLLRGGGGFLSTAHSDADLEAILQAVRDSVEELQLARMLSG